MNFWQMRLLRRETKDFEHDLDIAELVLGSRERAVHLALNLPQEFFTLSGNPILQNFLMYQTTVLQQEVNLKSAFQPASIQDFGKAHPEFLDWTPPLSFLEKVYGLPQPV